jgi:uncharacterized protein
VQLAAASARLTGDEAAFGRLGAAAKQLPLSDAVTADPELLRELAPDSFYYDWLERSVDDPYWARLSPQTYAETLADLPMLHIGGWFDTYLRGTVKLYRAMAGANRQPQHLIIGPWAHLPWGRYVGALDFGEAAVSPCDRLQVRWFDYWLKDIDNGVLAESPVRLFEMGRNEWRLFEQWPDATIAQPQTLYLQTTGLTAMTDGVLSDDPPRPVVPQPDRLVHDPWRPVPTLGGHAAAPAGSFDRSALDCRSDILTYTTEPLAEPLQIVGEVTLTLVCQADVPSWDIAAVLADVHPNGKSYNFAQSYLRIQSIAPDHRYKIQLQPTCMYLPKGHRLRLSLSAADFPAYSVNPGTGASAEQSTKIAAQVITIAIHSQTQSSSQLQILTLPNHPSG